MNEILSKRIVVQCADPHSGNNPGVDDVVKHRARANRGELVYVAHDHERGLIGYSGKEPVHQHHIYMDASSITTKSASRGLSRPRLKPKLMGANSSSRWMVFASSPVNQGVTSIDVTPFFG